MSSPQSVVQQASDLWVIRAAVLNKLTTRAVWLSTMSFLVPSVSPWGVLWGLVVVSPLQTALLVHDMLLTLPLKVKHIWRKKLKLGSILYFLARYPAVLVFLYPFPQFQTIKVSSYSPRNAQSSRNHLVRVSSRFTRCLTSKQSM